MILSYVGHDSLNRGTRLIPDLKIKAKNMIGLIQMWDMMHSYDSLNRGTRLIPDQKIPATHTIGLIQMWDIMHSYVGQ